MFLPDRRIVYPQDGAAVERIQGAKVRESSLP
jgi:hypothetical protein